MQPQWSEKNTEGKIHHSFSALALWDTCPSCVDESAYIFWQLWAKGFVKRNHSYCFDWAPLFCWERKMLSNVIAPQHLKLRHAHIWHQKGNVCFLFTEDNHLALCCFPWPFLHIGSHSPISNCRERSCWPARALDDWARRAWHSSWPIVTDTLIKVALASTRTHHSKTGGLGRVGLDVQLLWLHFHSAPSGPGHQENHWHGSFDAGKMAEANSATHEKEITASLLAWQARERREEEKKELG